MIFQRIKGNSKDNKDELLAINALYSDMDVVCIADNEKGCYEVTKCNEFWKGMIGDKGDIRDLYTILFMQNKNDSEKDNGDYSIFLDDSFFKKPRYQGNIVITQNGISNEFSLLLIKISDVKSALFIRNNSENFQSNKTELEKIDTIQESYLFSMIVDLKTDSCINSNTTEVSASRQDYMDIKYSDWRMMISNMFLPEDKNLFLRMSSEEHIINTLEENQKFDVELKMMNMQRQYIWVRLSFNRMKGFSRENPRFVYTVQDINSDMLRLLNQQSIIQAVEDQNEKLQMADKNKSMFISNMSHEIRTPINAILGMDDMIIRECKDEKILSYAYDIKSASKLLLGIVNDILDYSKIESGKMEIIPVEYDTVTLISSVCNLISTKLNEKALDFNLKISENLPQKLYGDEIRITQIIINILSNAVKYTEKGSVSLNVREVPDNDRFALEVCIEDTGIGIKEEDMDKLFSAFERLDTKKNRKIEGTGLGMSIVVRLLEQMGSKLEVQSTYGVGSKFSFVINQKIVDETPIGNFKSAEAKLRKKIMEANEPLVAPDKKILIVDDTEINLIVVKGLLEPTKIQVDTATSGAECLEMIKKEKYDLIMLDHLMPEMDGVETLQNIRAMEDETKNIPIIALTANVVSGADDMYIGLGFSGFLEKPIIYEKMEAMLKSYLND